MRSVLLHYILSLWFSYYFLLLDLFFWGGFFLVYDESSFVFLFWRIKGFLDDQFNQLQQLQDESNPDFVVEVVSLFFEDSDRLLNELAKAL